MAAVFRKAIYLLPLLFVHGQSQGLFQNPFATGGQYFSGEGLLNPGHGNRDSNANHGGGFFARFPFFPFFGSRGQGSSDRAGGPPGEQGGPAAPARGSDKNLQADPGAKSDYPTNFKGSWALVSGNSGVSAMHVVLMPNNKLIMYDATVFHVSNIKLPKEKCVAYVDRRTNKQLRDCWAHGVEFDVDTANIRPLKVENDPWCSSGGLTVDGSLVGTGGWDSGVKTVRYLKPCDGCDFMEYQTALADPRWYSTQITLADGRLMVVGGRRAFSYEYVPPPGQINTKDNKHMLQLLDDTTDLDENNLYPFVYQSTDGNVFVFANNRSILLDPATNSVLRELPQLDGGARNYPASAMSALLPIRLDHLSPDVGAVPPAEVIVCGGARHDSYASAGRGIFLPALDDCNRIVITDAAPAWAREAMPSRRVMGDMLLLPTGDLLLLSGARAGTSAWFLAEDPNRVPALYRPDAAPGARFSELAAAAVPRMYHSAAVLLPDGKVLTAGSNTNPGYNYTAKYPTELRVEAFSPPYLDPALAPKRPAILSAAGAAELSYGKEFEVVFELKGPRLRGEAVKVTMYAPPFTTHGYSMNQRLLVLYKGKGSLVPIANGTHRLTVSAPPSGAVAPPGYYLLFVVHRGVPSEGVWVRIK